MPDELHIKAEQEQRMQLLCALYDYVEGKAERTISPMKYNEIGKELGYKHTEVGHAVRHLVSAGWLEYKPATQAVGVTHKGIEKVESMAVNHDAKFATMAIEEPQKSIAKDGKPRPHSVPKPNVLWLQILEVLSQSLEPLQLTDLKKALPEFSACSDAEWVNALGRLLNDSLINAATIASGVHGTIGAFYNIKITEEGRKIPKSLEWQETPPVNTVTKHGECVSIRFQAIEAPQPNDVFYLFKIRDLTKERGERLVEVHRNGPTSRFSENYETKIDLVRLNIIRRALDSGELDFDEPCGEGEYIKLEIERSDFVPRTAVPDAELRLFIYHQAYWFGYRLNDNIGHHVVAFDHEQDLEYLGITKADAWRAVWLLKSDGMLAAPVNLPGNASNGVGTPTAKLIREYEGTLREEKQIKETEDMNSRNVFIVHGHDEGMKESVARFLERIGLNPVILHEQPNKGRTIINKFEDHSQDACFAVVLLSPDDVGGKDRDHLQQRARQNVILELGYFIGTLGRAKVCALHKGEVELPSDFDGVLWVAYDSHGAWRLQLGKEIQAAEIDADLNRA